MNQNAEHMQSPGKLTRLSDRGKNQLKLRGVQPDEPHIFPIKIKGKKSNTSRAKGAVAGSTMCCAGRDGVHRGPDVWSFAF